MLRRLCRARHRRGLKTTWSAAFVLSIALAVGRVSGGCIRRGDLWPNGVVPYLVRSSVSEAGQAVLADAIEAIESVSCIRFRKSGDVGFFGSLVRINGDQDRCRSTSLGREEWPVVQIDVPQDVYIPEKCLNLGTVIHELLHALGFKHEHQRPDRDDHVEVLYSKIKDSKKGQFDKASWNDFDNHGTSYDFDSVMHYPRDAFAINDGEPVMRARNPSDTVPLERRPYMSSDDILTLNRAYNCPGPGRNGRLRIRALYARNLPNKDGGGIFGFQKPDAYMRFDVLLSNGNVKRFETDEKSNDRSPDWNENFNVRGSVQLVRASVYDSDTVLRFKDDNILQSQTFQLSSARSTVRMYRYPYLRTGAYADFQLEFTQSTYPCSPNPCQNRGRCRDLVNIYRCECVFGYTGRNCESIDTDPVPVPCRKPGARLDCF
eukprot:Plantae.Rhodophyta-Purpureofilum_apyrenoidigerum.ctg19468.p1 GENE.Plantae.Rhodophyta-Purpureofilum_apyrenoidigerum.ctg19468~~Plantae.Rhodophyta-Purpureofilum_apyrenoidigerum.ctg19468.p1  ORF type:complete len:432 (+),score=43.86 Plantae.Rhodophyta-Purpureofilum_apyrenoidigerum.ctg19468:170-1465(+)